MIIYTCITNGYDVPEGHYIDPDVRYVLLHDGSVEVPDGWEVIATSVNGVVAGLINKEQNKIATQFHPEVSHTKEGDILLNNFICFMSGSNFWSY